MRKPEAPHPESFIERIDYIQELEELVARGQEAIELGDTNAIYGSGKTSVLAKYYYKVRQEGKFSPLWIPLDDYSIYRTNTKIQELDSIEAYIQNYQDFIRLIIDIAEELNSDCFEGFSQGIQKINENELEALIERKYDIDVKTDTGDIDIGTLAKLTSQAGMTLKSGDNNVTVVIDDKLMIKLTIENSVTAMVQVFQQRFNQLSASRKQFLIVDDYCWTIDQRIGEWFLDLVRGMVNTIVIISRTLTAQDLNWSENKVMLHLTPFSRQQIGEYLAKRLAPALVTDQLVEEVYQFSHGHPLVVSITTDLVNYVHPDKPEDIQKLFKKLAVEDISPNDDRVKLPGFNPSEQHLYDRVDSWVKRADREINKREPDFLFCIDIGAAARRFDKQIIHFVLLQHFLAEGLAPDEAEGKAEAMSNDFMDRLSRASFAEVIEDGDNPRYQYHFIIRERILEFIKEKRGLDYYDKIFQYLAYYYQPSEDKENYGFKDRDSDYARMYRMEDPAWQEDTIEWLFYLCQLQDRRCAKLMCAKLYMEAFDWWGWYLPFKFNEDLLALWEQTQPADDTRFLGYLRTFQQGYPGGMIKRGAGNWEAVYDALTNLIGKKELYLTKKVSEMDEDERLLAGQIERFLAEACRFAPDPDPVEADRHYEKSLELFQAEWNQMWILSYHADLDLELGRLAEGREKIHRSMQMVFKEEDYTQQDHELISLNYRILGDINLETGDLSQAFRSYARSIQHAYFFVFYDKPDEYNCMYFRDTGSLVLAKLLELWQRGRVQSAQQAAEYMQSTW